MLAANRGDRRAQILVIGAAGVTAHPVVNDAPAVAVHEGAVVVLIAHAAQAGPTIDPVLGHPDVFMVEAAQRRRVAKSHHALARQARVVIEAPGKGGGAAQRVSPLNDERHHRAGGLRRNARAINAIPGQGIAAGAVVHHDHRLVGRRRSNAGIDAIEQLELRSVFIVESRGNQHGLAGNRNGRRVLHFVNGGAGGGNGLAVGQARSAQVGRHGEGPGHLQPIAVQAHQDFRRTPQPPAFEPQRGG